MKLPNQSKPVERKTYNANTTSSGSAGMGLWEFITKTTKIAGEVALKILKAG